MARLFWNNVEPFLSDEGVHTFKISLVKESKLITEDSLIAVSLCKFLEGPVKNLGTSINKHENHPSVSKIGKVVGRKTEFHF